MNIFEVQNAYMTKEKHNYNIFEFFHPQSSSTTNTYSALQSEPTFSQFLKQSRNTTKGILRNSKEVLSVLTSLKLPKLQVLKVSLNWVSNPSLLRGLDSVAMLKEIVVNFILEPIFEHMYFCNQYI